MDEVKRYWMQGSSTYEDDKCTQGISRPHGPFVLAADLDALRQRVGELEADNAALLGTVTALVSNLERIPYRDNAGLRPTSTPQFETAKAVLAADHPGRALAAQVGELQERVRLFDHDAVIALERLKREKAEQALAAAEGRVGELEKRQRAWRVLLCSLCGHDVQDPMMDIIDPVELVRQHLERITPPLTWSQEAPKEPGWYWWDNESEAGPTIVQVYMSPTGLAVRDVMGNYGQPLYWLRGSWAGPIAPPGGK